MDIKKFDISRLSGNRTFDPALAGYEDSIDIIGDELHNVRKSFVKIGWYLKHINEDNKERMYQKDGYGDIYEMAYAKFKMSKGTVNRMINLCIEFSVGHDSPELDEHYQEFDQSQLFEMLPMNEAEREEITPDMTVKQIREKKAEQKVRKEPPDKLIADFLRIYTARLDDFDSVSELKNYYIDKHGKSYSGGGPDPNYRCTPRGISLENYDEITWLNFAKRAWNLKESKEFAAPAIQKAKDGDEIVVMSDPEENIFVQTTVFGEVTDPDTLSNEVSEKPDYKALMEEACSLSQKLCEGFRFSAQNNTLSQIKEFKEWIFKLNNIAYTLYELSESL